MYKGNWIIYNDDTIVTCDSLFWFRDSFKWHTKYTPHITIKVLVIDGTEIPVHLRYKYLY